MLALLLRTWDGRDAILLGFVFLGVLLLHWLLQVLLCWSAYRAAELLPAEQREIEPGLAFLLLVPGLGLFGNFLVQPAVSRSYKRWFAARGVTTEGDCGEKLCWWYAIVSVLVIVPCVPLAGIAAIALGILCLLRLGRTRAAARAMVPA